jgi:hypothetical protein
LNIISASAILSGIKVNIGVANLSGKDNYGNCTAQRDTETYIDNIFKYAQDAGILQNNTISNQNIELLF